MALGKSASEEFDGGGTQVCHYPMSEFRNLSRISLVRSPLPG